MARVHNELPVENTALSSNALLGRTDRGNRTRRVHNDSNPEKPTNSKPQTDTVSLSDKAKDLYRKVRGKARDQVTAANKEAAVSALKDIELFTIDAAHSKNGPNAASYAKDELLQPLIPY